MNLGAQLGPVSITKLSRNWACQTGPIHCPKFLLSGSQHRIVNTILGHSLYLCSKLGQDPLEQVFTYLNSSKCSSLYCGLPQVRLQPLNGVLWTAARMISGVPRFGHITDYMRTQSALEFCPIHCPNGRLGQDLGFGEFAFALKLPELLNTNLAAVRAKLGQTLSP